jgi:hypothetical protein
VIEAAISTSMCEFLAWVGRSPRTYADTMDAWQSHCPRYTLWEDALAGDLVRLVSSAGPLDQNEVRLTPLGRAVLDAASGGPLQLGQHQPTHQVG